MSFQVSGELGRGEGCHCTQCRRWTGHFLASTEVQREQLSFKSDAALKWYHSSEKVRRGFCGECGSPLFFDPTDTNKHSWIGVSLGAFDLPTDTKFELHIFTAEKGDYYELSDGVPQNAY